MWSQGERARKINESGREPGRISEVIAGAPPRLTAGFALCFLYTFCFLSGTSSAYCCEN